MTLVLTIGTALVIVGLAILGAIRDLPRGIIALAGVLFGAALVSFWAEPFAADLSRRLNNPDTVLLLRVTSIMIFSITSLLLGFGSAALIPAVEGATPLMRTISAILGAFTGALAAGFLLSYAAKGNEPFLAQIRSSPVAVFAYDKLALLLLIGAALIGVAVIIRLLLNLFRQPPPPPEKKKPSDIAAKAASAQANDQQILDKIRQRTGSQ